MTAQGWISRIGLIAICVWPSLTQAQQPHEKWRALAQSGVTAIAPAPIPASRIGRWDVGSLPDGRPFAVGKSMEGEEFGIKELRIECVPGGRLEYVPVPAKREPVRALWMGEEGQEELRLSNGRVIGTEAVRVSKAFLASEAYGAKNAPGSKFTITLVLNQLNNMGSSIIGNGFSEMRRFLLDRCKN